MTDREHGTRARYAWGPDENGTPGTGCRCGACSQANRDTASHRKRMLLYGRWQPFVDAAPSREHMRMLSDHGIGWRRVAELAGIPGSTVNQILYGKSGRTPSRRIRPETEAAILAVQPSPDALGGSAPVGATGTHRRVQALVCNGWSQQRLSDRLGMLRSNFGAMINRGQVTAATARAVRLLYDELWDQAPPEAAHREKIAASRARNHARARGWVPPLAWDEAAIDDPAAHPADGWQRRERTYWRSADLLEEAAELARFGLTHEQAAERLGVNPEALKSAIRRDREAA